MQTKTILLFGVTGMTGKHVLSNAVNLENINIVAYARNVNKIPEEFRPNITVIEGDFNDFVKLKSAIKESKPDAIIVTSSLGTGNSAVSFNQLIVPQIVDALNEDGRANACRLVYLSGAFSPEHPFDSYRCLFTCLFTLICIKGAVLDNTAVQKYLYNTNAEVCYTVIKMGSVGEGDSKGRLIPYAAITGDIGAVFRRIAFTDMADLLLGIAQMPLTELNRQSYVVKYA